MTHILSLLLLPFAAVPSRTTIPSPGVPFEKAARDFMSEYGIADKKPEEVDFESIFKAHFIHGQFGVFELEFPIPDLDKRASDLKDCALALLVAQEKLLDWSKPAGRDQKSVRVDLKTVEDWIRTWRPAAFAHGQGWGGKDVTAILNASDSVVAASGRLAESLGKGAALGVAREAPASIRTVLVPTRKEFVELACFLGLTNEDDKGTYWVNGIADWGSCWIQDTQVVALEYSVPNHPPDEYAAGMSMNERDPTVMQQQVVQFALQRFFQQFLSGETPIPFIGGLAMNLVIDQFGEISTRLDGDLRGRTTSGITVFIAGAVGDGTLGKNSAETRWREDRGRDRFVKVLHQAQKEGENLEKSFKNRSAVFAIRSDTGGDLSPVHAPLLRGPAEDAKAVEAKFQGDASELQRAYKCAFVAWLQSKALSAEKSSREKFAQLLEKIGDPSQPFDAAFPAVYDKTPLSDAEAGKDGLEGKFLVWLSKQK